MPINASVNYTALGKLFLGFIVKPSNKRCSGLGLSARFRSPTSLAAELGVMRV